MENQRPIHNMFAMIGEFHRTNGTHPWPDYSILRMIIRDKKFFSGKQPIADFVSNIDNMMDHYATTVYKDKVKSLLDNIKIMLAIPDNRTEPDFKTAIKQIFGSAQLQLIDALQSIHCPDNVMEAMTMIVEFNKLHKQLLS